MNPSFSVLCSRCWADLPSADASACAADTGGCGAARPAEGWIALPWTFRGIYQVRERVARGPGAAVFHAVDTRDDRAGVLKVQRRDADRDELRRRLDALRAEQAGLLVLNEAEDGQAGDRRFPQLLGMERTDPPYLALERIQLPTLGQVLAGRGLDALEAAALGVGVFGALGVLHAQGMAHGALRPDAIFVREADWHVVIGGLGESRKTDDRALLGEDVCAVATLLRLAGGGDGAGGFDAALAPALGPVATQRPTAAEMVAALEGFRHARRRAERLDVLRERGRSIRERITPIAGLEGALESLGRSAGELERGAAAMTPEEFDGACARLVGELDRLDGRLAAFAGAQPDLAAELADEKARNRALLAQRDAALQREKAALDALQDADAGDDPVVQDESALAAELSAAREQVAVAVQQRDFALQEQRNLAKAVEEHRLAMSAIEEQYRELAVREQATAREIEQVRAAAESQKKTLQVAVEKERQRAAAAEGERDLARQQAEFAPVREEGAEGGGTSWIMVGAAALAGVVFGGAGVGLFHALTSGSEPAPQVAAAPPAEPAAPAAASAADVMAAPPPEPAAAPTPPEP
ncbi:MAG: hypothetical protein ACOZNI_03450, partial [Myxococcota bacterium]